MKPTNKPDVVHTLGDGGALAKSSTASMLRAEKAARKDMEAVVAIAVAALSQRLSALDPSDSMHTALAHEAIRKAHDEIERGLELAVAAAILRARLTAALHFSAQVAEVEWLLRRYEIPSATMTTAAVAAAPEDALRARAVSRSMASRWSLAASASATETGKAPPVGLMSSSINRAAATETARAYSEEHNRQMGAAIEAAKSEGAPVYAVMFKRWEGVLDRKICTVCANHDNEVVRASEPFRGGAMPGHVHPNCRCQQVLAITSTDLNIGHAVTRDVAGPGLGRAAIGSKSTRGAFEDLGSWTPEMRSAWSKAYQRAKADENYRARLITPEIRRHLESVKAGVDRHAPVVPRVRKQNPMREGRRTDSRSPRAIHEEYLGRAIGASAARFEYGELVAAP